MGEQKELLTKTMQSLRERGFRETVKKIKEYPTKRESVAAANTQHYEPVMDVLFINGCSLPHPARYRVTHQKEQLIANNVVSNEVYYTNLSLDQARHYRVFIFFRCPYTPLIGEFIKTAKKLHKVVLFDVDDLVIDTRYTDLVPYVQGLSSEGKREYDDYVNLMKKTLSLCDAAITTTERLAEELRHYVPEVIINRNTASERMQKLSEEVLHQREKDAADKKKAQKMTRPEEEQIVRIGYFSGSITHNSDIEMILPALVRIFRDKAYVQLHIVGELDLPEDLEPFKDRIVKRDFVDWEQLPALIGSVDINIAPLEANIFNEAKSENKWVEAALVKVPTVASDLGAFRHMIEHGHTGLLCGTTEEWYAALKRLIENTDERRRIAENAWEFCRKNCVTIYTGFSLTKYIKNKMTTNVAMVLPSLGISGGIMVALRHTCFLYDAGFDVLVISDEPVGWTHYEGYDFPVISRHHHPIYANFDKAVATMWFTVQFLETYPNIRERYYLVQNFETDFYTPDLFWRIQANQSYSPSHPIRFITISRWCQNWLWENFEKRAMYAPNGIKSAYFRPHKRTLEGRVRILIEGDCGVHYKNVDESFKIVDELDPERFEVWYMSYNAQPKKEYRVDRFLHRVPYEKVFEVYAQCDILLKSSFLESFSYPPLEMMASGGYAVVVPNEGNREYLRDRENCLLYEKGDVRKAVRCIEELCENRHLQETLYREGLKTAATRDWGHLRGNILALYDVAEKK